MRFDTGPTAFSVDVGHGAWRESAPLGRPVVAAGAWPGEVFVADLYVITSPSRVRLAVGGISRHGGLEHRAATPAPIYCATCDRP